MHMEMPDKLPLWRIDLLDALRAVRLPSGHVHTRFRTHKTGALLAYLAYHADKKHPREALIDLLWPDASIETGRHNLSNALTALRRQLEPSDIPAGTVFSADRFAIELHSAAVTSDVATFLRSLELATQAAEPETRKRWLAHSLDAYTGMLLPGYYEDWILPEQQVLQEKFVFAARQLTELLRQSCDLDAAIEVARRLIRCDGLTEENLRLLLELLVEAGHPAAALRQYRSYVRLTREQGGEEPSAEIHNFVKRLFLQGSTETGSLRETEGRAPGYVPARLTRFFGRLAEQNRLRELLSSPDTRLLTLIGPGGIGKTRLALELAGILQPEFDRAIWFVPLSDVTAAENLLSVVLAWMKAPSSSQSELQRLVDTLGERRSLLVLDNFEHLIEGGAGLVQALLERVPTLTCLITSRQRLQLSGENLFPVAPLPCSGVAATPEALAQNESARLFVDRAQAVRPEFSLTPQNAPAIAELCDRLEGIPLALELAAARADTLTPQQMLEQMKQRFTFLVSRHLDREPRHRALRETLIWSFRLQPAQAQTFFARLSVFCGGWTWEAAAEICEEPDALNLLAQLSESSLITTEEAGAEIRFRMLDTMKEFAREQISDDDYSALSRRHIRFFRRIAQQAEVELKGAQQSLWLDRLEREHDNFCTALLQCAAAEAVEVRTDGLHIAASLWRFWYVRGHLREGRKWFRRLLPSPPSREPDALQAKALNAAGCLAWAQHDLTEARALLTASLAMQRELGDVLRTASALNNLGLVARAQGDLNAAIAFHEQALALQRQQNHMAEVALSLNNLAAAHAERGEDTVAHALYTEGLGLWRSLDDTWGLALTLANLGSVTLRMKRYHEAFALFEEGLAINRTLGDVTGTANSLTSLGMVNCETGDYSAATAYLEEALTLHQKLGNPRYLVHTLHTMGDIALRRNALTEAAVHYARAAQTVRQMKQTDPLGLDCLVRAADLEVARGDAPSAARLRALVESFTETLRDPSASANSLVPQWERALDEAAAVFAAMQTE